MNLSLETLKTTSTEAVKLWQALDNAKDDEETNAIWESIWNNEQTQQETTDWVADFVDQIDADIIAIKSRKKHIDELHDKAIAKLQLWRSQGDRTILQLNKQGLLPDQITGNQRQISIRYNPPSCDVLIDPEQLPNEYQNVRTTVTANKKAIVAKWRKGIPIKGTRIYRKPKVVYSMLPTNAGNYQIMKQATKKNK